MCKLAEEGVTGPGPRHLVYEQMIDALNDAFRAYINQLAVCQTGDAACLKDRRELARILYENGRMAQCMIAEVTYSATFYGEPKPFRTFEACGEPHWETLPEAANRLLKWQEWPPLDSAKPSPSPASKASNGDAVTPEVGP